MFYSRLGVYGGQDGDQQTNLWKNWVGLGLGPSESGTMPYLVMDAVALHQTDLVCNLGAILDSQLLFKEQVTVVGRKAFPQFCVVCQLHPSPMHNYSHSDQLPDSTPHDTTLKVFASFSWYKMHWWRQLCMPLEGHMLHLWSADCIGWQFASKFNSLCCFWLLKPLMASGQGTWGTTSIWLHLPILLGLA